MATATEVMDIIEALRSEWRERKRRLYASDPPILLNIDDDDDRDRDRADDDRDKKTVDDDEDEDEDDEDDEDEERVERKPEVNWKANSRKNERARKRLERDLEDLKKTIEDSKRANQTEHERQIEAARLEERTKLEKDFLTTRRQDKLESVVTKLAADGVTVGEGRDARVIPFADTEDALIRVQRALSRRDILEDELFERDGVKISRDVLTDYLSELLTDKPHLQGANRGKKPPPGSNDAGRGKGGGKAPEDLSFSDHLAAVQKKR